jgi:hypothetical protein
MKKNAVIPSRADGEGPLNCNLRYSLTRKGPTAGARSLAVCAARDDMFLRESMTSRSQT